MADFDAIVVGSGLSGSSAALCMAKGGMSVLVVERGDAPGSKNMTGGRIYGHSLEQMFPGFAAEAPVERKIVREQISMMTGESCLTVDFASSRFALPASASYTVLRAKFDAWLATKAEEAGCDIVCPAMVEDLLWENGKVAGVRSGKDELTADVVLLADGVNSLLGQKAGLKKELKPSMVAVGCKEVIGLSAGVINDRFNLEDGEGAARLFAGEPTRGLVGGGFVYTNRESLSVGMVVSVKSLIEAQTRLPDMMEDFRRSAPLKRLLAGGKLIEYSAHLVPEAGINMKPTLFGDGVLLVGDAAGFCLNLGYTVRGMDYAITSGMLAAETAIEAKGKGEFSASVLQAYERRLQESYVLKDMNTHKHAPGFIERTPRLYKEYPELAEELFSSLFTVNGPSRLFAKKVLPVLWKAGILGLLRDALRGGRSI